jgi:glycosyltransferase involved in cell wall biosynthesis
LKPALLVVSDTPCVKTNNGYALFEPTLLEVEKLESLFSSINWLTYLRESSDEGRLRLPKNDLIEITPIPFRRGGHSWIAKLRVLFSLISYFFFLRRKIATAEFIHSRGPSVPALITILISFFDTKRVFWHKYGGNWDEKGGPVAYRIQRWLLKRLHKPHVRITVNGRWPHLHDGFISLENPCVDESVRQASMELVRTKAFTNKLKLCFVGNLDENKGADRLLHTLMANPGRWPLARVTVVGGGALSVRLRSMAHNTSYPVELTGPKSREYVFEKVFRDHHMLILPSHSEGFPKVVAEACAYGCIPIVTRMSSLDQYIRCGENGFLLDDGSTDSIRNGLDQLFAKQAGLGEIAAKAWRMSALFTYERFYKRVQEEIVR